MALCLTGSVHAREVELKLKDGRQIKGTLVGETPDRVIVNVAGISTPFDRSAIEKQTVRLTLTEEFEAAMANVKPGDTGAMFELARSTRDKAMLAVADGNVDEAKTIYNKLLALLNDVLKIKPDHSQAKLLRTIITDEVKKLGDPATAPTPTPTPTPAPDAPTVPGTPKPDAPQPDAPKPDQAGASKVLTQNDINLIKVFEVQLSNKPTITKFDNKMLQEMLEQFRNDPVMAPYLDRNGLNELRKLQGYQQLELLFKLRARDFYPRVEMRGDPEVIQVFKQQVYPRYVVPYFIRNFGDGKVKGLYLQSTRATREDVLYTNYLMLHRTKIDKLPVIDRFIPMDSLLIQWGLPRNEAKYPAPAEFKTWRPYFTGREDPRIKPIADWIKSLWGENDEYPIDFAPPAEPAAADAGGAADR
ncbi:MAG: hypothetical protein GC159_10520 [Phycisphaera sp.]|nr:hypothetical protein [Phycisphaera sp.]